MNDLAHLIAQPWLMHEGTAAFLYAQYLRGSFSLESLNKAKEQAQQKQAVKHLGLKGTYIGQYVWRTMMVKHSSGKHVAIMPVVGTLTKRGDLCSYGMRDYMAEISLLNEREDIAAIVLDMEGPGGTVDGTNEFGLAVANSKKPVVVFGDYMIASANYWVASQAKSIVGNANNPTEFGSIGVLCVHEYWGKYIEENIGSIKIIRAPQSKDKALVNPIEELTTDQEKLIVADLKTLATDFHNAVKAGRGDKLTANEKAWGTGKMFKVSEALEMGLIDAEGDMMTAIDMAVSLTNKSDDQQQSSTTTNANAQGAHKQINKKQSMNKISRAVSSFFNPKKAAAKAAAAEPAAAEGDAVPMWTEDLVFNTDGSGDGAFCMHADTNGVDRKFETKMDNNQGNEPPTDPTITEDDNWAQVVEEAAAEDGAEGEGGEGEGTAEASTVVKMNETLKKRNAEIKVLKAQITQLQSEKKALEDKMKANASKPAAPATTVVSKGDRQPPREATTSWERKAAAKVGALKED